ncbi:hypothetical protein E2C01_093133 [Portunus trituberculatus]|uniref:Uncharacterized protein n=1 Tax=Portunus trituberculatus TaxID=210409 RepID=A0A5B7JXT5_PORTR|nr:hypothetical protein [Portunus trituberculatus]
MVQESGGSGEVGDGVCVEFWCLMKCCEVSVVCVVRASFPPHSVLEKAVNKISGMRVLLP